jgi:hypothetical protein
MGASLVKSVAVNSLLKLHQLTRGPLRVGRKEFRMTPMLEPLHGFSMSHEYTVTAFVSEVNSTATGRYVLE